MEPEDEQHALSSEPTQPTRPLMSRQTTLVDAQVMWSKTSKEKTVDVTVPDRGGVELVRVDGDPLTEELGPDDEGEPEEEDQEFLHRALTMPPDALEKWVEADD
jgi:hypothetical protein